jgi:hypothetical protein
VRRLLVTQNQNRLVIRHLGIIHALRVLGRFPIVGLFLAFYTRIAKMMGHPDV